MVNLTLFSRRVLAEEINKFQDKIASITMLPPMPVDSKRFLTHIQVDQDFSRYKRK